MLPLQVKPLTHGVPAGRRNLAYMATRRKPTEFTLARGKLIQRARDAAKLSQAQLAKQLGLKSREVVSQYESGKIHEIGERTCRGLVAILGLRPEDLLEDPTMYQFSDELPTMSTEARRVARRWDSLPEHMRKWIVQTMDGYQQVIGSRAKRTPKGRPQPKR